jgi:RNA polymerase sigma factor (sigma-70 family)
MTAGAEDLLATRVTLLARLKDAGDQTGWQQFFNTYWKLLYGVALRSGLTDAEAQDAVQETVIAVARHIPAFKYDPAKCSFKTWLLLLARQRIVHQLRKRNKPGGAANRVHRGEGGAKAGLDGVRSFETDTDTATVDQLPHEDGLGLEAIWDEEWNKHFLSAAMERVKQKVSDRQFQIFDLYVLQNWSVPEVTRTLRVSRAQVYLAKHRVGRLLKAEIHQLS